MPPHAVGGDGDPGRAAAVVILHRIADQILDQADKLVADIDDVRQVGPDYLGSGFGDGMGQASQGFVHGLAAIEAFRFVPRAVDA